MKTAILILPVNDNHGQALPFVHSALRLDLCKMFGGVTVTSGQGCWTDPETGRLYDEPINEYRIAHDWTKDKEFELCLLAARYGVLADQLAVMVTLASGDVLFVQPEVELAKYISVEHEYKKAA